MQANRCCSSRLNSGVSINYSIYKYKVLVSEYSALQTTRAV